MALISLLYKMLLLLLMLLLLMLLVCCVLLIYGRVCVLWVRWLIGSR